MDETPRILLVSPDLMSASQIIGLARGIDAGVETLRSLDGVPQAAPFALVLVDLQALTGDAALVVSRVRAIVEALPAQVGVPFRLVAFGPHVQKQRLDAAAAAGADAAVSRGELFGGFPGLMARLRG